MSSNNSTINLSCPNQAWYASHGQQAYYIIFFIIAPIYLILGTFAHSICLIAFRIESKKQEAYMYQTYVTFSRTLQVISMVLSVFSVQWLGDPTSITTWAWYRSCYICQFVGPYLFAPLTTFSITLSSLFAVSMSADRMYALWKPMSYQVSNTKRNQFITLLVCITLALVANISQVFRYSLQINAKLEYTLMSNVAFTSSLLGRILNTIRQLIEAGTLMALYVCNIGMVWFFRKRRLEAAKKLNVSNQEKKRQEVEKTISLLAIFQSIFVTASVSYRTVYFTLVFFDPTFYICKGSFHMPLMTGMVELLDLCDTIVMFLINKRFRKMLRASICCMETQNTVGVTPVTPVRIGGSRT